MRADHDRGDRRPRQRVMDALGNGQRLPRRGLIRQQISPAENFHDRDPCAEALAGLVKFFARGLYIEQWL